MEEMEGARPEEYDYILLADEYGGIRQAARSIGIAYSTFWDRLHAQKEDDSRPRIEVRYQPEEVNDRPLPERGEVKRYILAGVQNNTPLNYPIFETVLGMAEHYEAEILLSPIRYIMPGQSNSDMIAYDPKADPYLCDKRVGLAPGLVFEGQLNVRPTAVRPLSGLSNFSGKNSMILAHPKVCMESVATGVDTQPKFNYSTGFLTKKNYIQRKSGQKAEFHHHFSILLVEVEDDGTWFARHVISDSNAVMCDLDKAFHGDEVSQARVNTIVWGDIHESSIDPDVEQICWGDGGIAETLMPSHQFFR